MTQTPSFATDPVDPQRLKRATGLTTVEVLAEACSTMDRAREIVADPACPLPAAIVADRQTLGRGRRAARWWQPPGSLAVSLVVDAAAGPRPIGSLACGVAVAEAIRSLEPNVAAVVRWPNDVEVDGRKLAGILVEASPTGRTIFGIGVNTTGSVHTAPKGLRHRLVTLPDLTGRTLPRQRLLDALVPRLLRLLVDLEADPNALESRYRSLCALNGTFVRVHSPTGVHAGTCRGIAADGALVLDTEAGLVLLRSGSLTPPGDEWRGDAAG